MTTHSKALCTGSWCSRGRLAVLPASKEAESPIPILHCIPGDQGRFGNFDFFLWFEGSPKLSHVVRGVKPTVTVEIQSLMHVCLLRIRGIDYFPKSNKWPLHTLHTPYIPISAPPPAIIWMLLNFRHMRPPLLPNSRLERELYRDVTPIATMMDNFQRFLICCQKFIFSRSSVSLLS